MRFDHLKTILTEDTSTEYEITFVEDAVSRAIRINVPYWARGHFWEEPPAGHWEFWAFKEKPNCNIGDEITFFFGSLPVAKARVAKIEAPNASQCSTSGRFKARWKIYWQPMSFIDLRSVKR